MLCTPPSGNTHPVGDDISDTKRYLLGIILAILQSALLYSPLQQENYYAIYDQPTSTHILRENPPLVFKWGKTRGGFLYLLAKSAKIRDFLQGIPKTHLKIFRLRRADLKRIKNKGGFSLRGGFSKDMG